MKWNFITTTITIFLFSLLAACGEQVTNSPHPLATYKQNIRFGSFASSPKTLDPAQSFSEDETLFISQIYESPLQYHYLKTPYTLVPLTAREMPTIRYWDAAGRTVPASSDKIAYTTYDIHIQPGILYQPHPAFAKDQNGRYHYLALTPDQLRSISQLSDFKYTGTRELLAEDYVYEIKRLAQPMLNSPILNIMTRHIVGLQGYADQLRKIYDANKGKKFFLDLRQYSFAGARVLDKYTYRITLEGRYPQFLFWLAMPFFAPIPWEADAFYSQPGMNAKNINFNWYPVGTGAYFLAENNPNKQMVLTRNPNFHAE